MERSERIEWCDIYRGLLILLVVIGHATGMFNRYIYQFHMAAFFVISGYTSSFKQKKFFDLIIKKFYKIMFPFFFLGIGGSTLFYVMSKLNILDKVSTTIYSGSLQMALLQVFMNLTIQCDWLGALWFLPVLFLATIMAKAIFVLARGNSKWIIIISTIVFSFAENSMMTGQNIIVLAGIAQYYFLWGFCLRKFVGKYDNIRWSVRCSMVLTVFVCLLWYFCSNTFINIVVDWPSRHFNGMIKDCLLPIFGIIAIYMISHLFSCFSVIDKIFSYIGKQTMGIMSFHFIGFKVAYALLILFKQMEMEEFKSLTPPAIVGDRYWFMIVPISIVVALLLWRGLNRIELFSFFLGRRELTAKEGLGQNVEQVISFFNNAFDEMYKRINKKVYYCIYFLAAASVVLLIGKESTEKTNHEIRQRSDIISVTFPTDDSNITFQEGWLPQSEAENYRWVEQTSKLRVFLESQTELHIEGFIPDNVTGMSKVIIYINNEVSLEQVVHNKEEFVYDIPLADNINKHAENEIKIEFDGIRIPEETDADQRAFSALVSAIEIR